MTQIICTLDTTVDRPHVLTFSFDLVPVDYVAVDLLADVIDDDSSSMGLLDSDDDTDDDTLDFREQIKNEHLIEKLMGEVTESNKEKETIKTEMKDLQDQIEALKKREEEANSRYESAKDALAKQLEENKEEVAPPRDCGR